MSETEWRYKCNVLQCRKDLDGDAIATVCCHIYCHSCAEAQGLIQPPSDDRVCPACGTTLKNLDDVVLRPAELTDSFRASAMCGWIPIHIYEAANKGIAFYNYQVTQEILYQSYLRDTLKDQCHNVKKDADATLRAANEEISKLVQAHNALQHQVAGLAKKEHTLQEALKLKAREHKELKDQYTRLKNSVELQPRLAGAAQQEAEAVLGRSGSPRWNPSQNRFDRQYPGPEPSYGGNMRVESRMSDGSGGMTASAPRQWQPHKQARGCNTQGAPLAATPSHQRAPIFAPQYNRGPPGQPLTTNVRNPFQKPPGGMNSYGNPPQANSTYGMTTGIRVRRSGIPVRGQSVAIQLGCPPNVNFR